MSKLFQPPVSIKVKISPEGSPAAFVYQKKPVVIRAISNRWRVREGWWREEVSREYFQVDTSRFNCLIYRDLLKDDWRLQRVYD